MNEQTVGRVLQRTRTLARRLFSPTLTFQKVGFLYLLLALLLVSSFLPSDVSAAPTVISGVVNNYWPGTASVLAGSKNIALGAARDSGGPAIAVGDLVLIIQMQNASINSTNTGSYGNGSSGSGSTNVNGTGLYEYATAASAVPTGGGTLTVTGKGSGGGLLNGYTNSAANSTQGQWTFQVVRVAVYAQAQLTTTAVTADPWNGSTGGVVAIDAQGSLDLNSGTIDVSGQGFRGGGGVQMTGDTQNGHPLPDATATDYVFAVSTNNASKFNGAHDTKGEGIAGTPTFLPNLVISGYLTTGSGYPNGNMARGAPGNGGGGGTDPDPTNSSGGNGNDWNTGGGGGGNGGAGGLGGCAYSVGCGTAVLWQGRTVNGIMGGLGGAAFTNSATRVIMGGGGGAGTENNQDNGGITGFTPGPSHGATGGGIVLIRACLVQNTGTINANGATAPNTGRDGSGGGGAGGTVLVADVGTGINGVTINAKGGNGGSAWLLANGTVVTSEPDWGNNRHGPGGGGGGGAILTTGAPASTSVAAGVNGVTTSASDPFGAQSGSAGTTGTITFSNIPGVSFSCTPTAVTLSSFSARGIDSAQNGVLAAAGHITLSWTTASEVNTAGFNLYRSEQPAGPYTRINTQLIPASTDPVTGGKYQYVDANVVLGKTYYYQLEDVELNGASTRHNPVSATVPAASGSTSSAALAVGLFVGVLAVIGAGFFVMRRRVRTI